jgi:hypothetical protein
MKAREFFLRNVFKKWLEAEDKLTSGGVSSYVSNLAGFFETYSNQLLSEAQFEALIDTGSLDEIQDVLNAMYTVVNVEKHNPNALLPKSKLSDVGSALRKYEAFLCEYADASGKAGDEVVTKSEILEEKYQAPISPLSNIKKTHLEVDDIRANFTNRLISQDRPYGNVYFPISIIKKLFYRNENRGYFDKWKNEQLNKIIFHTNEKPLTLNEIKSLKIENDGSVLLICNDGQTRNLYTKLADNVTITQMYVSKFSQVVIDHVVPMKEILIKNERKLSGLLEITKSFNIHGHIITRKDIVRVGNKLLIENIINHEVIPALKNDLQIIGSFTELQLMEGKQNSMKSSKF